MKKLVLILLFLVITGCATFSNNDKNLPAVVITTETEYILPEVNIPPNLLQPCEDLNLLEPTATFTDVIANTSTNTLKYNQCKAKHRSLVELLQKSLGLK